MFLPPLPPTFDAALRDAGSNDPKYRAAAVLRLQQPPDGREAEAREALLKLADDPYGPIREDALDGLAHVGEPADLELLRARFDDGHIAVRQAAVRAAFAVDPEPKWIETLLEDPRDEMRFVAVSCLAEASDQSFEQLPDVGPMLVAKLDDPEPVVAAAAAEALGERGDVDAVPALESCLERPGVQRAAAVALAQLGESSGESVLIAGLSDRTFAFTAVEALGLASGDRGREALAAMGQRRFINLLLKAAAGTALARQGDARGEQALSTVLRAWRADGRDYAVHAAGELELVGLVPLLERLVRRLRGADPNVLGQALERLAPLDESADRALVELQARYGLSGAKSA